MCREGCLSVCIGKGVYVGVYLMVGSACRDVYGCM